jgi:hypothetical protein
MEGFIMNLDKLGVFYFAAKAKSFTNCGLNLSPSAKSQAVSCPTGVDIIKKYKADNDFDHYAKGDEAEFTDDMGTVWSVKSDRLRRLCTKKGEMTLTYSQPTQIEELKEEKTPSTVEQKDYVHRVTCEYTVQCPDNKITEKKYKLIEKRWKK